MRLPKKLVGVEKHRGFAFVEYYTKSDAKVGIANRIYLISCSCSGRKIPINIFEVNNNLDRSSISASIHGAVSEHSLVRSKISARVGPSRGGRR